jgi:hypothetical protein
MRAGATLDDVLRTFGTDDRLGAIESIEALRRIAALGLSCAKLLVATACGGRSYAHLTLTDLELLADAPRVGGVDSFTRSHREKRSSNASPTCCTYGIATRPGPCPSSPRQPRSRCRRRPPQAA